MTHLHRVLLFPDANQGGTSSDAAGSTAKTVDAGSSGPLGSAKTTSSDKSTDASEPETMADAVAKHIADADKVEGSSESSTEADAEQLGSENEQNAAEDNGVESKEKDDTQTEGDKEATDGEQKSEGDETNKGPVPYERFQEVTAKVKQFEQQLEQVKPIVEGYNAISTYCQQNDITQQDFNQALEMAALANKNPEEFVKRMAPLVEQAKLFTGDKLPPDLQTKVDNGAIELEDAQELARLRSKSKFGDASTKAMMKQAQEREYNQLQTQLAEGARSWETARRAADPDYKPKAKPTDPDGKWEMTKAKFLAMLNETDAGGRYVNPVSGPKDMVKLMDSAAGAIDSFMKRHGQVRKATPKHLGSNQSSTNGKTTIKTIESAPSMAEAVKLAMKGR